jgi:hypothetical protein
MKSINAIGGLFIVTLGLLGVIFHRSFAKKTMNFYFKGEAKEFTERLTSAMFLFGGILFMIFGLLGYLGIIQFR